MDSQDIYERRLQSIIKDITDNLKSIVNKDSYCYNGGYFGGADFLCGASFYVDIEIHFKKMGYIVDGEPGGSGHHIFLIDRKKACEYMRKYLLELGINNLSERNELFLKFVEDNVTENGIKRYLLNSNNQRHEYYMSSIRYLWSKNDMNRII